jgi:hypothetical protein
LAFASLAVFVPFHAAQAIARSGAVQAEVGWNVALASAYAQILVAPFVAESRQTGALPG